MGMTTNEAIEAIKCNWPDSRYTILREALDMAISSLRQQETVIKCHDLFDEDGGEITHVETVTNRNELNEPLTMDELWKIYDGEEGAVWVKNGQACFPAILDIYDGELVAVWSAEPDYFNEKHYGKTWLAYRQKPEE